MIDFELNKYICSLLVGDHSYVPFFWNTMDSIQNWSVLLSPDI